jgi:hypothetical protein
MPTPTWCAPNLKTKTDGGHPAGRVPLWISGPPPPDSGRSLRRPTYPQQSYTTTGDTAATRYDKTATSYAAGIAIAATLDWFKSSP